MKPQIHLFGAVWLLALLTLMMAFAMSPARGHSIYEGLRDTTGRLCCHGDECEPVTVELRDGGYFIPASGEFISESAALVSPDDRFHRCTWPINKYWRNHRWIIVPDNSTLDGKPKTLCFFAPRLSS
jgi:hypothetical protein